MNNATPVSSEIADRLEAAELSGNTSDVLREMADFAASCDEGNFYVSGQAVREWRAALIRARDLYVEQSNRLGMAERLSRQVFDGEIDTAAAKERR